LQPRRAVRNCQPPDDPASTFKSPIDRRSCVDPSDFRPCGFSLGDDDETADSIERISESRRRRYVPGSCTVGPSHAVFRYPEIELSSRPGRILESDNVPGLLPFAVLILPRQRRRMFPCRQAHVSFSAHPPRCFFVEGSAVKFYRSLRDGTPLHPREFQEATVDRGCAGRLLGLRPCLTEPLPAGKPFTTKAAGTSAPTSFCRWSRSCHGLRPLSGIAGTTCDALARARPRAGRRPPQFASSPRFRARTIYLPSAHGLCDGLFLRAQRCKAGSVANDISATAALQRIEGADALSIRFEWEPDRQPV